jgi:hypothetical protein
MIQPSNPTLLCRCAEPITAASILTTRMKQDNDVENRSETLVSGREVKPSCAQECHQNCSALHRLPHT